MTMQGDRDGADGHDADWTIVRPGDRDQDGLLDRSVEYVTGIVARLRYEVLDSFAAYGQAFHGCCLPDDRTLAWSDGEAGAAWTEDDLDRLLRPFDDAACEGDGGGAAADTPLRSDH